MNRHMDEARDFISRMNLLLTALLVVICLAGPRLAKADDSVQVGVELKHPLVIGVCLSEEAATKVVDSFKEGQDAANETANEMGCQNVPLLFTPNKVVYVASFGDGRFLKVVEITNSRDGMTLYWFTFKPIVLYKVDNDA